MALTPREAFKDGYAAIAVCEGIGRDVLEARLRAAAEELQLLFDNLTACQKRGTTLVEEKRDLASALQLLNGSARARVLCQRAGVRQLRPVPREEAGDPMSSLRG